MILIFWDYDGTLVDTETIYRASLISFFEKNNYNLKKITTKYFYKTIAGKHPEEFLEKLEKDGYIKKNLNIDPMEIKKYYSFYFKSLKDGEIKITDGIDSVIDKLSKNSDVIMCITSSSYIYDFEIKYKNVKNEILDRNFDTNKNVYLCGSIENCNFKPAPDIFVYAFKDLVKKHNLKPTPNDRLVIVEDSIAGCKAGREFKKIHGNEIGIDVVGYLGGAVVDNSEALLQNGADLVIKNAAELEEYFNNLTKGSGL